MLAKPPWPLVDYIINYDFIVTELCENKDRPELKCDGKCYMAKMFAKESRNDHKNPFAEGGVHEIPIILCLNSMTDCDVIKWNSPCSENPINNSPHLHSLLFVFEIIQPPEMV